MTFSPSRAEPTEVSVVVRTRDEADRLRLTLTSLACQTIESEVVVVDDGSTDHTADVIAEAREEGFPLRVVTHATALGRSAASNAGARAAVGGVVLFLDGDNLAGPTVVATHAALHRIGRRLIARGETWHLRCTRFLHDPETVQPQAAHEARLRNLGEAEREAMRVTRQQIRLAFDAIERRAQPGIYPGHGPRRLHQLEFEALRHHPNCDVLWAAASGSNLSVQRRAFLDVGGFDERLDINEHRELALRLCQRGGRVVPADGARTYHMTHRNGWRDPLQDKRWEAVFYASHPIPAVALLSTFWAGLSNETEAPIKTLPDLAARAALESAQREAAGSVGR